jgi:hypothetical protein
MRPKPETIPMAHEPCHAESPATHLALQQYTAGRVAPEKCHEHILRAAILAGGCAVKEPCGQ